MKYRKKPVIIVEAVQYLGEANEKELYNLIKDTPRKIVEKFYTWDYMGQKFEDFLMTYLSDL